MFKKLQDVQVVVHGNGGAIFVIPSIGAPIQESEHIFCMNQERGLRIAQNQMTLLRGGSIKVSRMRLTGLKGDMNNFLNDLLKILTLSQGLCKRLGRGKQLNYNNKHQTILLLHNHLQFKKAE